MYGHGLRCKKVNRIAFMFPNLICKDVLIYIFVVINETIFAKLILCKIIVFSVRAINSNNSK